MNARKINGLLTSFTIETYTIKFGCSSLADLWESRPYWDVVFESTRDESRPHPGNLTERMELLKLYQSDRSVRSYPSLLNHTSAHDARGKELGCTLNYGKAGKDPDAFQCQLMWATSDHELRKVMSAFKHWLGVPLSGGPSSFSLYSCCVFLPTRNGVGPPASIPGISICKLFAAFLRSRIIFTVCSVSDLEHLIY